MKSRSFAGVRSYLYEEFNEIWCFDLRGNQRTKGEMSKKEGGKIFGSGSKAPVAIILLVKNPRKEDCTIHYKDIGEYHTREQKLEIIKNFQSIQGIKDWTKIVPNTENDWLHQSDNTEFIQYNPIGKDKSDKIPIFGYYKNGVVTAQDEWVYNRSATQLAENMKQQITYLNENMHDKNPKHLWQ